MVAITNLHPVDEEQAGTNISQPVLGNIRDEWGWVKIGLEEILYADKTLTFKVEDVYALCVTDQAALWIADGGFCITTTEVDEFTSEKTLLLWLGWTPTRGNKVGLVHTQFFLDIAKENGYAKLELRSKIKEIGKYLTDAGWSIDTTIYSRRV